MKTMPSTKKKKVVICDLDHTLYPGATIKDFGRYLARRGKIRVTGYGKILWWLFLKSIGHLNDAAAFAAGVNLLRGFREVDLQAELERAYHRVFQPRLGQAIPALVKTWQAEIGPFVIATETLQPIAELFGRDLGATAVLGTAIEIEDGRVTGRLAGPVLQGAAKNAAVREWAEQHGIDLAQSVAVGGRLDDVPLLKLTGRAIVLHPDRSLRHLAEHQGWQIIDL
ncbi:haloacid dehalogenase-like hydrolase [Candidatus Berkelbacteria bacterium]|nr:haloacid dehalogenase-like hydrolase [Candidatus Berkelbacteria bacterium]